MNKVKKITLHTDSAHGWLAVKRSLLIQLDILTTISVFSYQSKTGDTVYLEYHKIEYEIIKAKTKDRSHIRNYPHFQLTKTDLMKSIAHKKNIPLKDIKLSYVDIDELIGIPEYEK
jgi:hypothetical protein